MVHLEEMHQIVEICHTTPSIARFLTVYIQEASSGKGLDAMKPVADFHRSLPDRAAAARKFIADTSFKGEVVLDYVASPAAVADRASAGPGSVDHDSDNVMLCYAAYPDRTFIIHDGVIVSDGGPPDQYGMRYDIAGVMKFVQQRRDDIVGMQQEEQEERYRSTAAPVPPPAYAYQEEEEACNS